MIEKAGRPFISTPILAVFGRLGGFVLPFVIAWVFGANPQTDAFWLTYSIIFFLIGLYTHLFEAVLIPYLAERRLEPSRFVRFSNAILFYSLISIVILLFGIGFLIRPFFETFSDMSYESLRLLPQLFFVMWPLLVLGAWVSMGNGILYSHKVFWFPAISPLIRSILVFVFLALFYRTWGIHSLSWGFAAGEILRWGILILVLIQCSPWRFKLNLKRDLAEAGPFLSGVLFQMVALFAIGMVRISDQWFASWLAAGELSLLAYADRLMLIPYFILTAGFLQIIHSDWSDSYFLEKNSAFWKKVKSDCLIIISAALILSLLAWFFKGSIVRLFLMFGTLSAEEYATMTDIFGWYAIAFVPGVMVLLSIRILFVLKKIREYSIFTWGQLILNIICNYLLIQVLGVQGIAVSKIIIYSVASVWFLIYIGRYRSKRAE